MHPKRRVTKAELDASGSVPALEFLAELREEEESQNPPEKTLKSIPGAALQADLEKPFEGM